MLKAIKKEEKEGKKESESFLHRQKFEKAIENIIQIKAEKDIPKKKKNNSFSYLIVFKDKKLFRIINTNIFDKIITDHIKNPTFQRHTIALSSSKYVTNYNKKKIQK